MSLVYPIFLFTFLPIFLALFALGGRIGGPRGALLVLVASSLLFTASQGLGFLIATTISLVINYALLMAIIRARIGGRSGRAMLAAGIVFNLALLVLTKYSVWLQWMPGIGPISLGLSLAIPTTLSFLTFQRSVALLDAFTACKATALGLQSPPQGEQPSRADPPLRYLGFASMFPNLMIGPIAYLTEILPQIARRSFGKLRAIDISIGLTLLIVGMFKKFFLADALGADWVDPVYLDVARTGATTSARAAGALAAYYVQLYFDFSGYSDMAIGVARMIGVRLPMNFDSPLRATGIIDFYRRWHMTLTRVISRFLFSPLSIAGTRYAARWRLKGIAAKLPSLWLPLIINFTVIGLWHGPRLTFVVFGLIHGTWYVIETEFRGAKWWKKKRKTIPEWRRKFAGAIIAIPLLVLTFALFRSPTLAVFVDILHSLGSTATVPKGAVLPFDKMPVIRLVLAFAIAGLAPNAYEMLGRYRPAIRSFVNPSTTPRWFAFRWRPNIIWAGLLFALAMLAMHEMATVTPFVYQVY